MFDASRFISQLIIQYKTFTSDLSNAYHKSDFKILNFARWSKARWSTDSPLVDRQPAGRQTARWSTDSPLVDSPLVDSAGMAGK
jgi:hypothetical protein